MRILCTNDDGYLARGLNLLTDAARDLGDVVTVAPDREQSATSHSLTIHRPLRAREARPGAHVVDGTPTDCVIVALRGVLDSPPDLCLSGVNHGPNMGEDVLYSGTVAAAMEATVLGIPSVALSYAGEDYENLDGWASVVRDLLARLTPLERFPKETLLNVNLPPVAPEEVRGVRVTNLGQRRYSDSLTRTKDPRGREYFWIGGTVSTWSGGSDSDFRAVEEGYISVTPLHLDLTNYRLIEEIRGWDLDL
jgi:5'-nucleotidase